jgi:hypothetical protein
MARSDRLQVTVSPAMSIALEVLAARSGLTKAAQAMVVLRQGLARTIETSTVQERLRERRAQWTARQWQEDTTSEHAVEQAYLQFDEGALIHEAEQANQEAHARSEAASAAVRRAGSLRPADSMASEGMAQPASGGRQ